MKLADVLARLQGVRAYSGYFVARCPAHDDRNASLSIREGDNGRVLLHCFAGCCFEAIRDALAGRPWRQALGLPGASPTAPLDDGKRTEIAQRIWRESRPAAGTLVEPYLRSRHITIPVPPSLRFHPNLKHPSGVYGAAMVAVVQNQQGAIVSIHRTWLRCDGSAKAELAPRKAALGPIRGCAIRFAKAGERLALAEGIETSLSIVQACPELRVWCAISGSNLPGVELPDCVREVIIAADADDAGERAAQAAARRFHFEGRKVRIAKPSGANDFNDRLIA